MSIQVDITIDDSHIRAVLGRIKAKVRDTSPLMRDLAGIMHDAVEENFEKEGRPGKWQSLAPSTIKQRQRKGNWPGRILQSSRGRLASSIQAHATRSRAIVGTNVRYAAIHQFGGEIKMKARQQVIHFSQARKGQLTGGRDRFATKRRAKYAMKVDVKAHSITIPARPFLHLEPTDLQRIMKAAQQYLADHS